MILPVETVVERYSDNLYRAALSICKNSADAEDAVQETFIQYYMTVNNFESEEHIRAWLMRVAINKAKNINLTFWKRNRVPWEEYMNSIPFETEDDHDLFQAIMELPEKYRIAIHLFYYEDYSIREISEILVTNENTVKSRLARGRRLLREKLQEEWVNDRTGKIQTNI